MPASEAEKKFWNCRELVERLFVYLDISSLAALLEAHKKIIGILTKSSVTWNNLTRRTVAGWDKEKDFIKLRTSCEAGDVGDIVRDSEQKQQIMDNMLDLVKIMRMMSKIPGGPLDLLDLICERFPALPRYTEVKSEWQHVKVSCPHHGSHSVALIGFLCLEAIEGALGTAQQAIELVEVDVILKGEFLDALNNRLSRQLEQGLVVETSVKTEYLYFSKEGSEDISLLMQKGQVEARYVKFGDCGCVQLYATHGWGLGLQIKPVCDCDSPDVKLDWAALGMALGWGKLKIGTVLAGLKKDAKEANREDVRAVWEAISHFLVIPTSIRYEKVFEKERGEQGWQALEQFLDAPEYQWSLDSDEDEDEVEEEDDEKEEEDDEKEEEDDGSGDLL